MARTRTFSLERLRTDGWFERLGESIDSFDTLCEVFGARFFAFALIVGARVSSLMIDRFSPDQSQVEFSFGALEQRAAGPRGGMQRLSVAEFRERLVNVLLKDEPPRPDVSELGENPEALQRFIGSRVLLLAPLFGYGLKELAVERDEAILVVEHETQTESLPIEAFKERIRSLIAEELGRARRRGGSTAIDLNDVAAAEKAAADGQWTKVIELLGTWPMPLAIYWRTPEGQLLPEPARQRIAEGLSLLGAALAKLDEPGQGEEVMRLAIQYAQDGSAAGGIFAKLGGMMMTAGRRGEAIGALRRAHVLSGPVADILLQLATALIERRKLVAALGCLRLAREAGARAEQTAPIRDRIATELGPALERFEKLVDGA